MAEYSKEEIRKIEDKWRKCWAEKRVYKTEIDSSKPKYYVLDMFPYPSGAGLHVGHPLGYIASDIVARFKRVKGFNVLHPMGFDAFGLPAEQYAIQTGQHPAITTAKNIETYKTSQGVYNLGDHLTKSASALIGTGKYKPATPPITNGHSGFSCSYLMHGITRNRQSTVNRPVQERRNLSQH